jgi:hypothetical protein
MARSLQGGFLFVSQQVLLYIRAFDLARSTVDLFSFATGAVQTVWIEQFVDPRGVQSDMVFIDQSLGALCTAFHINAPPGDTRFNEVYNLVVADHELFMALNDLMMANTLPHLAATNCGRVMDAMRRMVASAIANRGTAWGVLQTELNVSRDYRAYVTDLSASPRHADRSFIPGSIATEVVRRTWTMFNRLLEYKKRRNVRLSAPEFPLL